MGIVDYECHLGHVAPRDAVVLGHPNELAGYLGYEAEMVRAFCFDEAAQFALGKMRVSPEVTQSHGLF